MTLTPGSNTLVEGATQQLTTQITDPQGNLLTDRPLTFSSDATAVATVSSTGLITAVAPGSARITASSEGKSGTATVQVIPVPVATVQVTPLAVSMVTGTTQTLTAIARSASGAVLNGRTVTWTSGAPSVASVGATGVLTGVGPGVVLILAAVDGVTATSTVTVVLPTIATITLSPLTPSIAISGSVQMTATLRDLNGVALSGRTITWASDDESIAFVSSSGLVVGFKLGTTRITATSEGVSASTIVTVR